MGEADGEGLGEGIEALDDRAELLCKLVPSTKKGHSHVGLQWARDSGFALTSFPELTDVSPMVEIHSLDSRREVFVDAAKLLSTWVDRVISFCDSVPPPGLFGARSTPIFPSNRSFGAFTFLATGRTVLP